MPNKSQVRAAETAMRKAQAIIAWRDAYYPDKSESDGPWLEHLSAEDMASPPDSDVLNFAGLGLTSLPAELADADGVAFLFLQSNKLTSIDASLLIGLDVTSLNLIDNPLEQVPEALFHLPGLIDLYLCSSALVTLPVPEAEVPQLKMLNLADNPKLKLPNGFFRQFTQLKALILDGYSSTEFPHEVLQLTTLRQLSLDRTKFSSLPSAISQLNDLRQLSVHGGKLTTLPKSIAAISTLAGPASKLNFMGLKLDKNPFADKALRQIAKLKNPERTVQAMAWADEFGSVDR